jgi:hypothetical protein
VILLSAARRCIIVRVYEHHSFTHTEIQAMARGRYRGRSDVFRCPYLDGHILDGYVLEEQIRDTMPRCWPAATGLSYWGDGVYSCDTKHGLVEGTGIDQIQLIEEMSGLYELLCPHMRLNDPSIARLVAYIRQTHVTDPRFNSPQTVAQSLACEVSECRAYLKS